MGLLHADADAFFASVEARDRPELADRPFVVGAGRGGVVACANYPARAYGVHGGMPINHAVKMCPELEVVPGRFDEYERTSAALFELFNTVATAVEPGSMEEAFLAVDSDDPADVARDLRRRVRSEVGLPLSVGVGRTKLVAKLASRRAKPDGLLVIVDDAERQLRDSLRITEVWGIGPVTRDRLCSMEIHTVRDLDAHDVASLTPVVGLAMARRLVGIAAGTDDAEVRTPTPGRMISGERSVLPPSRSHTAIQHCLTAATDSAVERLSARGQWATRVDVTVTYTDGDQVTARANLAATGDGDVIGELAAALLAGAAFAVDPRDVRRVRTTLTLHRDRQAYADQPALPF